MNECDLVQHLILLLSSVRRHQSACLLRHQVLDRKHEPVFLWVRRMGTSHHVLHCRIQNKYGIETADEKILSHPKRKLLACVPI